MLIAMGFRMSSEPATVSIGGVPYQGVVLVIPQDSHGGVRVEHSSYRGQSLPDPGTPIDKVAQEDYTPSASGVTPGSVVDAITQVMKKRLQRRSMSVNITNYVIHSCNCIAGS